MSERMVKNRKRRKLWEGETRLLGGEVQEAAPATEGRTDFGAR